MKKAFLPAALLAVMAVALAAVGLVADDDHDKDKFEFQSDTLVVTRSVYTGVAGTVTIGETLPPGCQAGTLVLPNVTPPGGTTSVALKSSVCVQAVDNGEFPSLADAHNVWNNSPVDGLFGVSSPIYLDSLATDGKLLDTLPIDPTEMVTSFSSKSELAVHRSVDGKSLTFMGYRGGPGCPSLTLSTSGATKGDLIPGASNAASVTAANLLDVSSTSTPGLCDPTDGSIGSYYRSVAEVDAHGHIQFTDGNAYSGDNSRSVIKANWMYYAVGNDNNGAAIPKTAANNTEVGTYLANDTGAEILIPGQTPPVPPNNLKIGDFSLTQLGDSADKPGKENNFRGMTIYHNTLYVTKGSGSNGINTVYQVGCAGELPTVANAPGYCAAPGTPATLLNVPITILPGFSTTLASAATGVTYPFGLWFADDSTLYVCDEGDGTLVSPAVAGNVATTLAQTTAGVQKWRLISGTWTLQYVLSKGLNIGVPYSVANYPASLDPATGGCRNMTGQHNGDGTVTIYAITSTISNNGDTGADPNKLVKVTDLLEANTLPTGDGDHDKDDSRETFTTIRSAKAGEVLRGVTWAPKDGGDDDHYGH